MEAQEKQQQHCYDLEQRAFQFALRARRLVKHLPRTISNYEDGKQLVRASGSVGANYIEANESLGDKDCVLHMKISRKEAKESHYWLRLLDLEAKLELEPERIALVKEADELMRIFGSIVRKRTNH
jgi:four helix bundle protein